MSQIIIYISHGACFRRPYVSGLSVPLSWTQYLKTTSGKCLCILVEMLFWAQSWTNFKWMFKGQAQCNLTKHVVTCNSTLENKLSEIPWGNVFRFGRHFQNDSWKNWYEYGGQRLTVKVSVNICVYQSPYLRDINLDSKMDSNEKWTWVIWSQGHSDVVILQKCGKNA